MIEVHGVTVSYKQGNFISLPVVEDKQEVLITHLTHYMYKYVVIHTYGYIQSSKKIYPGILHICSENFSENAIL